jgi:soluble lytic murein transglycosylase
MRLLFLVLAISFLLGPAGTSANAFAAVHKKKPAATAKKKSGKSSKRSHARSRSRLTPAQRAAEARRVKKLKRAFVASASLKPMARQLLETHSKAAYAGVQAYAQRHAKNDAGRLAYLVLGYAHNQDREFLQALPALQKAKANEELADYASYFTAIAYNGMQQQQQVATTLGDFGTKHPDSLFLRDAELMYANALRATGNSVQAVQVLEQYRSPQRADYELALGRAYVESGDAQKGGEILRHLYLTVPASDQATEAKSDLDKLANVIPQISYEERRQRADLLFQSHHFADAAREYSMLVNEAPEQERDSIKMYYAVSLHRSGQDRQSRELLDSMPETGDESDAQRQLILFEIARDAGDEARMKDVVDHLRQKHVNSPAFDDALLQSANHYLLHKDYDRSIDYWRELQQRFPQGRHASYAHWKEAWLSLRQNRVEEAKKLFEEQVQWYPQGSEVAPALYWRARLAEEDGDLPMAYAFYSKLAERFRNYYYAVLARQRLASFKQQGDPPHYALLDLIPQLPDKPTPEDEPPADDVRVQRSRLLENAGLTDFAIRELLASPEAASSWGALEVARIQQEGGRYDRAIETMKRAVPNYWAREINDLPRGYWEALFPRPYWSDLRRHAAGNGLDPFLVASLIRQESEFNPGAISHANAWGLMQVLPGTGKKVAKELKIHRFNSDLLLSPTVNLQIGTRYFRNMVDEFGGQVEYALAAYNAGSNRVDDWRGQGHYRDVEEFVESIPFTETREYVQAIMRNAAIYKELYGANDATATGAPGRGTGTEKSLAKN